MSDVIGSGGDIVINDTRDGIPFAVEMLEVDVEVEASPTFTFDTDVRLIAVKYFDGSALSGDKVDFWVKPPLPVGKLDGAVSIDDTTFIVDTSVLSYVELGFYLNIGGELVGPVVAIDSDASTITLSDSGKFTSAHLDDTDILFQIWMGRNIMMCGSNQFIDLGDVNQRSSKIPAGVPINIDYKTQSAAGKKFVLVCQYYYGSVD